MESHESIRIAERICNGNTERIRFFKRFAKGMLKEICHKSAGEVSQEIEDISKEIAHIVSKEINLKKNTKVFKKI